uniref:Uncharacterized protein n=1 Tax=Oryza sativa subsp. japonica TaxID=39947 RepID=Q6K7X7_ORYSJ|nr:hypothetical protein [Oryza sativa Japonica Group]BAD19463.1 hypothetical protein [Oryza sativa Japonica Group]
MGRGGERDGPVDRFHRAGSRVGPACRRQAGWRTVDRAREGGEGKRRLTRSQPTWLRRGCHAGQREEEEGEAGNERRTAAEFTGARHGLSGKREHTGEEGRDETKRADGSDSPEDGRNPADCGGGNRRRAKREITTRR